MKIARADLTQKILQQYLKYDPITGWFTWKIKYCRKIIVGERAGSVIARSSHRALNLHGTLYPEHRLAFLYMTGSFPKGHVDHKDHNELNNIWGNLRDVSQQVNNMNLSKRKDNSTGHTGIWINNANTKKKYMAEIHYKNKRVFLQSFYSLTDAINARKKKLANFGFHPNHGISKPT